MRLKLKFFVPFWILVFLFVLETFAICFTHSLTARLALCDTVLLVIILSCQGFECGERLPVVLRMSGLIAFEGLIFVNLTHAVQMIIERHDEGVHLKIIYVGLAILDILIKILLWFFDDLPRLNLNLFSRIFLHFSATFATLFIAILDFSIIEKNIILIADPLFTTIIAIFLALIVLPSFFRSLPFLFGDIPKDFKIDDFKREITEKFTTTTCDHMHVYRRWPGNAFDVFLTITYRCDMKKEGWIETAQCNIVQIQKEVTEILKKVGAKNVTVQPNIVECGDSSNWNHCITSECQVKSCCTQINRRDPI